MSLIVSKFGGISLADAESIKRTAEIIRSDPARRYIVVASPGIRSGDDIRVTDMKDSMKIIKVADRLPEDTPEDIPG